jgi:hypothetical protein
MSERRGAAAILAAFGVFWCLLVGVFTLVLRSSASKSEDAERRFRPVQASILSSRVDTRRSTGKDEHWMHRPAVRFAYEVDGRRHESETYGFDDTSSSDRGYAERVVARYPAGRSVTAWYDPERPVVAVLEKAVAGPVAFGLFFMRPFWAAGAILLFMAGWTGLLAVQTGRYLFRPPRIPCRIPGWGRLRRSGNGFAVTRRPKLVLWAAAPYFFATFVSLFVLVLGDREDDPAAQEIAFRACLVVTGVVGTFGLFQGHRVRFERDRIVVARPFRREEMPASDVASVEIGEASASGRAPRPIALYLKAKDGRTLRLNVFSLGSEALAVASRARQQISELLGLEPSGKAARSS